MDSLQAGLEKLAMKPKVGWCEVHTYVVYCPTQLAISLFMLCSLFIEKKERKERTKQYQLLLTQYR